MFFVRANKKSIHIMTFDEQNKSIFESIDEYRLIQWANTCYSMPRPEESTDVLLVELDMLDSSKEVTQDFIDFVKLADRDFRIFLPEILKNRLDHKSRIVALYLLPGQESKLMYITMKYNVLLHIMDAHKISNQIYE